MSEHETSLQEQMLAEQRKQTALLEQMLSNQAVLIQALAEDQDADGDHDAPSPRYLDGSPCL